MYAIVELRVHNYVRHKNKILMQTLSTLLRKLAVVTQHIAAMQNQQVAYCLASNLKSAASFTSVDYVDIADIADHYVNDCAKDLCPEDIKRLKAISDVLCQANAALQTVQDVHLAS